MTEKKHTGENHPGPDRSSPYGISRLAPQIGLVDVAREIEQADHTLGVAASSKLKVIAEQIYQLQQQARAILDRTKQDLELHRASCRFTRLVGHVYHLYERKDGSCYWSMLSIDEWRGTPPDRFCGSYRLEPDQSWAPLDGRDAAEEADPFGGDEIIRKLLGPGQVLHGPLPRDDSSE